MNVKDFIAEIGKICPEVLAKEAESKKFDFFSPERRALQDAIGEKNNFILENLKKMADSLSEKDGSDIIAAITVPDVLTGIAGENFFDKGSKNHPVLRKLQFKAVETVKQDSALKYIEAMGFDMEIRRHAIKQYRGRGYLIQLFMESANSVIKDDILKKIKSLPKAAQCSACKKALQPFSASDCANQPKKTSYICPDCGAAVCADCSYQAAVKHKKNGWICPKCLRPIGNFPARLAQFE